MAFKTVQNYNEDKFGGFFLLRNDGDYADVVFLYQSVEDVLVADVHYIKSADYSGYVHCCGKGCPACAKGIRTQTKLFIPVYNIQHDEIQIFDRTMRFEPQLQQDVFSRFPNPSEYVFRITRHGAAGSVDTKYEITAIGKNTFKPYAQILAEKNVTMPEYYNTICKEVSMTEMNVMINSVNHTPNGYSPNEEYHYEATPRAGHVAANTEYSATIPEQPVVSTPTSYQPPENLSAPEPEESLSDIESSDDESLSCPEF